MCSPGGGVLSALDLGSLCWRKLAREASFCRLCVLRLPYGGSTHRTKRLGIEEASSSAGGVSSDDAMLSVA